VDRVARLEPIVRRHSPVDEPPVFKFENPK
jgi:hypothetical protein